MSHSHTRGEPKLLHSRKKGARITTQQAHNKNPLEYSRQMTRNELQGKRNLGSSRKQKGRSYVERNAGLQPFTGANNSSIYKGEAMQDENETQNLSTKSDRKQRREGEQGERPEPSECTLR